MKSKFNARYKNDLAFLDMMFNMCVAFAFLFIIAMTLIKPHSSEPAVKLKAEIVLTMTWPDAALDDIDMWVLMPDGRKVNYMMRDMDYITLDRDDRGASGDIYTDPSGERKLTKLNREMITIRALVPGRYVIAAHVFNSYASIENFQSEQPLPYPVKLEVLKLNPYKEVARSEVTLTQRGESQNFVAFTINEKGQVVDVVQNPTEYSVVQLPESEPPR